MQAREETIDIDSFARRHIGPSDEEVRVMLRELGFENLDSLIDAAVPKNIRLGRQLNLPKAKSEIEALAELRTIARTKSPAHLSAPATTIASRHLSFSETFSKIRAGTPLTLLIRPRLRKAGSKRSSIFSR